jgi:hypothetical protein
MRSIVVWEPETESSKVAKMAFCGRAAFNITGWFGASRLRFCSNAFQLSGANRTCHLLQDDVRTAPNIADETI